MQTDVPQIIDELNEAKRDLSDALEAVNERVEKKLFELNPEGGIRKHPVPWIGTAAVFGILSGLDSNGAPIGALLLAAAIVGVTVYSEMREGHERS